MKYFICGFMAAGKTTALKRLSEEKKWFGYSFVDLDIMIFEKYGKGYENLGFMIEDKGFDWFRKVEKEVLIETLMLENVWIALGGGTLDDATMEILSTKSGIKGYFLNTDLSTCLERISNNKKERPLGKLADNDLKKLYEERMLFYSQFEPLVIS